MKRIKFGVVAGVSGVALSLFGAIAVYPTWFLVMVFWFGCLALQYWRGEPGMARGLTIFHRVCVLGFPAYATFMKWRNAQHGVFEDISIGNRIQHFSWALCTVGLFVPMLRRWIVGRSPYQQVMMIVGFVAMLGNLNEIGEWSRSLMAIDVAYRDTMLDLTMNLLGSTLGALIVLRLCRSAEVTPPSAVVEETAHESSDGRVGFPSLV